MQLEAITKGLEGLRMTCVFQCPWAEDVECLPGMQEALSVISAPSNPSTQEMEAGGSKVQGHPWSHCEFNASMGHTRHCLSYTEAEEHVQKVQFLIQISVNGYLAVYSPMFLQLGKGWYFENYGATIVRRVRGCRLGEKKTTVKLGYYITKGFRISFRKSL